MADVRLVLYLCALAGAWVGGGLHFVAGLGVVGGAIGGVAVALAASWYALRAEWVESVPPGVTE